MATGKSRKDQHFSVSSYSKYRFSIAGESRIMTNISSAPQFSSVQLLSRAWLFATPWIAAHQVSLSITNSQSLLKLMSIQSAMPSNHLSSVVPFSSCLQSCPESGSFPVNQFFTSGGQSTGASASASVLPVTIQDLFPLGNLLAVQETLKSLLRHHSSKASILQHSAFFMIQLSHPYMTTGKTIVLTTWTFVGKVMSLLFNMLSRLVIAFLPRSKYLLISWLQSQSAVLLEPPKIKSLTVSTFPHLFAMKWWDQMPWS